MTHTAECIQNTSFMCFLHQQRTATSGWLLTKYSFSQARHDSLLWGNVPRNALFQHMAVTVILQLFNIFGNIRNPANGNTLLPLCVSISIAPLIPNWVGSKDQRWSCSLIHTCVFLCVPSAAPWHTEPPWMPTAWWSSLGRQQCESTSSLPAWSTEDTRPRLCL